ncbi:uncharacterized protein [Struthio camelus]|uniref:uncharacterized protein isoform X2 n=1 Tax=Struthio camelus TaxID=8801 RepID=UPI00360411CB
MRSSRPAQSTKQSCAAALCCRVRAGEAAPCCRVLAALLQTCPCGKRLVANGERDFFPAAQICPEETIVFLYCKLRSRSKADRVAAVEVLQALVRSAATETREKLPLFAKLVQSVCGDPTVQVQMAVLHFIGELLRSSAPGCSAWDVVAHIFSEFSRASGRLASGKPLCSGSPGRKGCSATVRARAGHAGRLCRRGGQTPVAEAAAACGASPARWHAGPALPLPVCPGRETGERRA